MMTNRRSFLAGLTSALAMPSIVRAESLMKIATLRRSPDVYLSEFGRITMVRSRLTTISFPVSTPGQYWLIKDLADPVYRIG